MRNENGKSLDTRLISQFGFIGTLKSIAGIGVGVIHTKRHATSAVCSKEMCETVIVLVKHRTIKLVGALGTLASSKRTAHLTPAKLETHMHDET